MMITRGRQTEERQGEAVQDEGTPGAVVDDGDLDSHGRHCVGFLAVLRWRETHSDDLQWLPCHRPLDTRCWGTAGRILTLLSAHALWCHTLTYSDGRATVETLKCLLECLESCTLCGAAANHTPSNCPRGRSQSSLCCNVVQGSQC